MEVLCERCQTEYDFDDALVSERGTTVKCTNCGHQFRIYRPKTLSSPPERWEVRTTDGRDLVFTSLRDLQRGITRGQVGRADVLTRGGLPSRALSEIAELEPFFPESGVPRLPSEHPLEATPKGLGPLESRPPVPSIHRDDDDDGEFEEATMPRVSAGTDRNLPPAQDLLGDEPAFEPETRRRPTTDSGETSDAGVSTEPPRAPQPSRPEPARPPRPVEADVKPPRDVAIRGGRPNVMTPTPSDVRATYGSIDDALSDPRFLSAPPPKRSAAARWVLAVVVLGALGVLGATVGRSYLMGAAASSTSSMASDPRVAGLLEAGLQHMKDGDLEAAKASFDKASVLAESDLNVSRALAHLANIKTDQAWLKLRLLGPDQVEVVRIAQSELETRAKQGLTASERAWSSAKDDPESARVRVDALRLAADLSQARSLVPKFVDKSSEPDFAYVLAALEMSEKTPNWTTVVDRLRVAAAGEQNLGRARAALVYALLRSGQVEAAKTELQTLEKRPRPHPLILELKAFFTRMEARAADGGIPSVGGADADVLDPAQLPAAARPGPGGPGVVRDGEEGPGGEVPAGSHQDYLRRAHAARQRGDLDAAEQLYRAALAQNPGDTEALSGLGDIAKARGDKSASVSYYEEVNKQNPGYIPALMGLADAKWDAGDKAGAVALYQQVISATSGQGPYAGRARQRVAEASRRPDDSPAPSEPAPSPPGVDTSDLPSP
jgi:predicted Zn finger-like uncharacterized protein